MYLFHGAQVHVQIIFLKSFLGLLSCDANNDMKEGENARKENAVLQIIL
jgi:hypothetical protein